MHAKTAVLISLLAGVHLLLLFAGCLSPYDPRTQNRDVPYAPPTRLHFVDNAGFHWRPFIYAWSPVEDGYAEDHSEAYPIHLFVRGDRYQFFGLWESNLHAFGVGAPAKALLLGTDGFGRDVFSRVLWGGQVSVAAGIAAAFIALLVGALVGTIAGFYGGWLDESLMGITELFLSLPWFYFLLGVRAFLPLHLSPVRAFFLLASVIGLIGWTRPARLVRGIVLSVRDRNHVAAARGFGASNFYLLRRHIIPEAFGALLTQSALLIPRYIAAEATLSFFGLGVSEPTPSWGNMLSVLQQYSVLVSYTWLLAPAAALFITSVIYALVADHLHSRLESRST